MSQDEDEDVTLYDLSYSKKQLLQASMRLATLKNQYHMGEEDKSPDEISVEDFNSIMLSISPIVVISDCQVCVELSAKAMFKTVGANPLEKHDIDFTSNRVKGLLSGIPDDFERSDDVPRVIFLTQFWERFYTLAKYGVPERNLSSRDIMNADDAKRAIQDAEYCLKVATSLHDHMLSEKDLEISDLDLAFNPDTVDPHS